MMVVKKKILTYSCMSCTINMTSRAPFRPAFSSVLELDLIRIGAEAPWAFCQAQWLWTQYKPLCCSVKRYAIELIGEIAVAETYGTPSSLVGGVKPCQCSIVDVFKWLHGIS